MSTIFTRSALAAMIETLLTWERATVEFRDWEDAADSPDQDLTDTLTNRIDWFNEAIRALEHIDE